MKLIDAHCHLFDLKGYELPEDILPVVIGYSHRSNQKAVQIAKGKYPYVLGIAPQTVVKQGVEKLDEWIDFISENKPNAIGEVGLDYKWARNLMDVTNQKIVFEKMMELADKLDVPIVIHSRNNPENNEVPKNAIDEIIEMIDGRKALMHFFSGTKEQAERIVANGGYISIVHLHSKERRRIINNIALDRLLVESDSPFIGRTPDSIREAVSYIAEIKGITNEEVAEATAKNAMEFFGFEV